MKMDLSYKNSGKLPDLPSTPIPQAVNVWKESILQFSILKALCLTE